MLSKFLTQILCQIPTQCRSWSKTPNSPSVAPCDPRRVQLNKDVGHEASRTHPGPQGEGVMIGLNQCQRIHNMHKPCADYKIRVLVIPKTI
jgi:hypothetical protein